MTSIPTRFKYFFAGLGLIAVAMVCSLFSYLIGVIRVALIDGRRVRINFSSYFRRQSIDELLNVNGYNHLDIEVWRANRATA